MASHTQSYKAGEAQGRTRERGELMKEDVKNKAEAAKQKTFEATEQVKDKAEATKERTKDGAHSVEERSRGTAESAGENAAVDRERSAGILQKTGEKMRDMAHGAADAVKHTFGLADADEEEGVKYSSRTDTSINH